MSEGYDTYCGLLRLYDEFSGRSRMKPRRDSSTTAPIPVSRFYAAVTTWTGWRETETRSPRSRRLCDWLHRHVRHFDTAEKIEQNSLSLLAYSFDNGREAGINCIMQAIVLTEACLSVGLPARMVGLHPLSPHDMDQHYVTVVWGRTFGEVGDARPELRRLLQGSGRHDPEPVGAAPNASPRRRTCHAPPPTSAMIRNTPRRTTASMSRRASSTCSPRFHERVRYFSRSRPALGYVRAARVRRAPPGEDRGRVAREVGTPSRLVGRIVCRLQRATQANYAARDRYLLARLVSRRGRRMAADFGRLLALRDDAGVLRLM